MGCHMLQYVQVAFLVTMKCRCIQDTDVMCFMIHRFYNTTDHREKRCHVFSPSFLWVILWTSRRWTICTSSFHFLFMEPGGFTPCTEELWGSNLPGGCASQQSVTWAATKARCVDIGLDIISEWVFFLAAKSKARNPARGLVLERRITVARIFGEDCSALKYSILAC